MRQLILNIGTVNATEQNSVHFVMLPTNATHLLSLSSLKTHMESYTRWIEEGSANGGIVWQEIMLFFIETFREHSKTKYEQKNCNPGSERVGYAD